MVSCAVVLTALAIAAATRAPASNPISVAPDRYESLDATAQTVADAQLTLVQTRTIDAADYAAKRVDWDSYSLVGTPGILYSFETTGVADTMLEVRGARGAGLLGWYDDKPDGSLGSKGYWRCTAQDTSVTVRVGPADSDPTRRDDGTGEYAIVIRREAAAVRPGTVSRLYGSSRTAAAVALAASVYRDADGDPWHYYTDGGAKRNVQHVIITSGNAEAGVSPMIAQPLAGIYRAPILLTGRSTLPAATSDAIKAIRANNGGIVKIHVVGPTRWVSSSLYGKLSALKGRGGTIERISADDPYALAVKVADRVDLSWVTNMGAHASTVIVANGSSPSALTDLLSASGIAYRHGWPILLTKSASVPASTYGRIKLGKFKRARVLVANSAAYVNPTTYTRLGGDARLSRHRDPAASAVDIAQVGIGEYWLRHDRVVVVSRVAEALTAGSYSGRFGVPVLVSGTDGPRFAETSGFFLARPSMVDSVTVIGSTRSVSAEGLKAYGALVR